MLKMIRWLEKNFPSHKPSRDLIIRATRHLKADERKNLFSSEFSDMRTAEGRWFEGIIYEQVLELSLQTEHIGGIMRRGADVQNRRAKVGLGQNGLFYAQNGDIKIRGNGQDLAEVDLVLTDNEGRIAFAEIITSSADMKSFEQEIFYKKRLLGYMFGQPNVPFLLISSVDISRISVVKRIVRESDNALIITRSCEDLKSHIRPREVKNLLRKPHRHHKMIGVADLPLKRPFDYKEMHDERRRRIIDAVTAKKAFDDFSRGDDIPPLVKKVFFGALYPSSIGFICQKYPLRIKKTVLDPGEVKDRFSKVVLATDIPELGPILYLRSRKKREYFKMVPDKSGGFRFQGLRNPHMKGFFLWLESTQPNLGTDMTEQIISALEDKGKSR